MKRLVGVFALSIAICAFGGQASAACNQNKLNSKINKFDKQCDKVHGIVDVQIPAANALMDQNIGAADSKMAQQIEATRNKESVTVDKLQAKIVFYTAKQADALVTCAINLDFLCNAAISFAQKITNTALKIDQAHEKADQKVVQITASRNSKVSKIISKNEKTVTALQTKQAAATNKANQYEHQAVLLPECNVTPDVEPFLCEPIF